MLPKILLNKLLIERYKFVSKVNIAVFEIV